VRAYDELIKYSEEYTAATGDSPSATKPLDRAAEITYLVLRLSKGDVRLRLGALARKLGVGSRVLSRRFHELYGATPKDCQIRFRVEWASDAIRTSADRKIATIAADCGYSDIADFNHVFRKFTGVSPKQYREMCRKADDTTKLADRRHELWR
jgi:transcriptional regulator GlxA family with amidase domain